MSESTNKAPVTEGKTKHHFWLTDVFIRLVKEKPLGTFGLALVLLLLFTGTFADFLAPYPYQEQHLADRLQGPQAKYLLGTDQLGRDVFSRIIHGARISMFVGLGASLLGLTVATAIGMISGYLGGKVDIVIQRFVDVALIFPVLLMIITLVSVIGQGLWQVIVVLGVWVGIGWIRVIRSAVIAIREDMYVHAAKAIGGSHIRLMMRHILPNITPILVVIFTVDVGTNITTEATLSFLGLGVPPPFPSWGGMLSSGGRRYMYQAWWLAIWPGVALSIVVFGIHVFGDALRDIIDPRLRGGVGRYEVAQKKLRKKKK